MSYRQNNFNRRSVGGQGKMWQTSPTQQRRGDLGNQRGGGGFSDSLLSIPSLLTLEVGRQNRQQQQLQQSRATYSAYSNAGGLLGNAPTDISAYGSSASEYQASINTRQQQQQQSLLGPGPASASGSNYGSGLGGNYGVNRNRGFGDSSGLGGRQAGLGNMDEALAAKVRLQQAMLAAQALQSQTTMLGGNRFQSGSSSALIGRTQDFDSRRRDLSPRGGQMGRRGQQQFRNRDNRNQDRNRNQFAQQQQQRNRDRNRQNLNKKNDIRKRQEQQRQQQRKQVGNPKSTSSKDQNKKEDKEKGEAKTKTTEGGKGKAKEESEGTESKSDIAMATSETTTYDPSEPTEDDAEECGDGETNRKRKRSENKGEDESQTLDDISVTIKKNTDGRAVSEPPRKKTTMAEDKVVEEKEEEKVVKPVWFCHVCEARCSNLKNYESHMKGNRHRQKMEQLKEVSEFQSKQARIRLQAEHHIKKVFGDSERRTYCDDCKEYVRGSIIEHRKTADHKNAKKDGRPHCRVCNVTFKTPKKFVAHCNTPGHKKVYDIARKKAEEEAKRKGKEFNEEEEGFLPPNMEDFVTLDAVGFEDGESDSDDDLNISGSNAPSCAADDADRQVKVSDTANVHSKKPTDEALSDSDPTVSQTTKPSATSPPTAAIKAATDNQLDLDLGPYNPDIAVGQEHVVPVAGFFCKLCHKFYNNESNAKGSHCKSKSHYQAVKKYMNKQNEALSKIIEIDSSSDVDIKSPKSTDKKTTMPLTKSDKEAPAKSTTEEKVPRATTNVDEKAVKPDIAKDTLQKDDKTRQDDTAVGSSEVKVESSQGTVKEQDVVMEEISPSQPKNDSEDGEKSEVKVQSSSQESEVKVDGNDEGDVQKLLDDIDKELSHSSGEETTKTCNKKDVEEKDEPMDVAEEVTKADNQFTCAEESVAKVEEQVAKEEDPVTKADDSVAKAEVQNKTEEQVAKEEDPVTKADDSVAKKEVQNKTEEGDSAEKMETDVSEKDSEETGNEKSPAPQKARRGRGIRGRGRGRGKKR